MKASLYTLDLFAIAFHFEKDKKKKKKTISKKSKGVSTAFLNSELDEKLQRHFWNFIKDS